MELVIKIDEEEYEATKCIPKLYRGNLIKAIANGTPLPKGHGRLVDENHVIAELVYRKHLLADNVTCGEVTEIFDSAVVVEAEKESSNGADN